MTLAPETTDLKVQLRLNETDGTDETNKTAEMAEMAEMAETWLTICDLTTLTPGRGVAALLPDARQVAVFRGRGGELYAIDNRDPFTGAAVLSRGLTGTHQGRPFVASPLLKQRFDLASGQCLDDETVRVTTYEIRTA